MKCPWGNHHHHTHRSYVLCHSRGFNHELAQDRGMEDGLRVPSQHDETEEKEGGNHGRKEDI